MIERKLFLLQMNYNLSGSVWKYGYGTSVMIHVLRHSDFH